MARLYDLVLMLDPQVDDGGRDKLADDARQQIEAGGQLEHSDTWGMRKMAYEIRQRNEADYRYFRFQAESNELLERLDHNLKIADGVLRFRIFKVDPETPTGAPPTSDRPASVASDRIDRDRDRGGRRDRDDR
jgi:small subunit ribosomal protein S6